MGPRAPARWTVRTLPVVLLAAVLAAGCGVGLDAGRAPGLPPARSSAPTTAPAAPPPQVRDAEAIQDMLDEVAAAFRAGDPDGVAAHLHDPSSSFGTRWQDRARNMAALPLASYELALDDSLPDLSTSPLREAYDGDVQVVYVVERLALEGFDRAPAANDLFLTVVDDGGGWEVAADTHAEPLGFVSVDHLFDHGPVTVTSDGAVMAIHHPDGPPVAALLDEAAAALDAARQRWPLDWTGTVPILVPRDQEELAELLHVTFDLSNFVAFATATPVAEHGEYELTGSRIVVNPARFLDRSSEIRQRILVHELVHVATRPVAGPMIPSWLDEGVAQAMGEQRSTTGTDLVDALPASALALPTAAEFTVGGRDRIFLSYQLAWAFVDHLLDRFGAEAVGRFYAAAGQGTTSEPGTQRHLVDQAAREVLGASLSDLVAGWRSARR